MLNNIKRKSIIRSNIHAYTYVIDIHTSKYIGTYKFPLHSTYIHYMYTVPTYCLRMLYKIYVPILYILCTLYCTFNLIDIDAQ